MDSTSDANGDSIGPGTERAEQTAMPENARQCPTSPPLSQTLPQALTDRQLLAIDRLARGVSLRAVARKLEIDPKTLYRWRQQPAFKDLLSQRRRELWSDVAERLRAMCDRSLDELDEQLRTNFDTARMQAATTILRLANVKAALTALDEA